MVQLPRNSSLNRSESISCSRMTKSGGAGVASPGIFFLVVWVLVWELVWFVAHAIESERGWAMGDLKGNGGDGLWGV